MMELLAGPTTVARFGKDNRVTRPLGPGRAFWDDEIGLVSLGYPIANWDLFGYGCNYFVAQLDGTCGGRGEIAPLAVVLDLAGPYEWAVCDTSYDVNSGDYLYGLDKQSDTFADKLIARGGTIFGTLGYPQILASDRIIAVRGPTVMSRAVDGSDAGWVTEYTLTRVADEPESDYYGDPTASRTKDPHIVCLIYPGGSIVFYDVSAKARVIKPWVAQIGINNGAWYSVKFDIYISCTFSNTDWDVSVWANAVRPASLSSPEPASSVVGARVSQIRVRLMGDHGEACEGELISWSITAGDGALTSTQSMTGPDGYAYVGYIAPVTGGLAPTIQAAVEF